MEQARILALVPDVDGSPLARARLRRRLTVEEAARRAAISPGEVQWLEAGRLSRFPTPERAILATVLYATALGVEHREALGLAGLPVPPLPFRASPLRRLGAITAFAALVLAAVAAIAFARDESTPAGAATSSASASPLPAPWAVKVVVLNGSGDIVYTRTVASHIRGMGYRVTHVGRATSFGYPQTQVYYPPGGEAIAVRLAKALDVPVQPLPGGTDPRRLVVIAAPEAASG